MQTFFFFYSKIYALNFGFIYQATMYITNWQLLQGYFPSTLLNINYENLVETSSPTKKIDGHNFSQARSDNTGNCNWLSVEEEHELVKEFINKYCSTNRWTFLTQLEEFLITVVETVKDNIWP